MLFFKQLNDFIQNFYIFRIFYVDKWFIFCYKENINELLEYYQPHRPRHSAIQTDFGRITNHIRHENIRKIDSLLARFSQGLKKALNPCRVPYNKKNKKAYEAYEIICPRLAWKFSSIPLKI